MKVSANNNTPLIAFGTIHLLYLLVGFELGPVQDVIDDNGFLNLRAIIGAEQFGWMEHILFFKKFSNNIGFEPNFDMGEVRVSFV